MNKYQSFLIGKCFRNIDRRENNNKNFKFVEESDKIILKQDENIELVEYTLTLSHIYMETIEKIFVLKNDSWQEIEKGEKVFIKFNFEDRTSQIKFVFTNNLADDYIVNIEYVEADKAIYYAKKDQEHRAELIKTANIKVSTGTDLANIYFQPCNKNYSRSEITLYKDNMMLAKYKVEEGSFFKSIAGLTPGTYYFELSQFDSNGNLIIKSDKIKFSIINQQPFMGHIDII